VNFLYLKIHLKCISKIGAYARVLSTKILIGTEFERFKVIPKSTNLRDSTYLDEEEVHATIDDKFLSSLVCAVSEVCFDEVPKLLI
jgi:hypothetical protein